MRPRHRADAVEGVSHVGHPVAQRVVHRVLQRAAPAGDRHNGCAQQAHAEHVRSLTFHVMRTHVDHALQPELGADRGSGHAMLPGSRFGDDACLAHAAGQDDLSQHVVDFVRAGVVQLVALHVDFRAAQMVGQSFGEIKGRGAADIVLPQPVHLGPESGIGLGVFIAPFQFQDQRHQGFADEPPAEDAETAGFVGTGAVAVDAVVWHGVRSHFGDGVAPAPRRVKALRQHGPYHGNVKRIW